MSCPAVDSQESKSKLPPGYYIYTGRRLGASPPRYVVISEDGTFRWDDTLRNGSAQSEPKKTDNSSISSAPKTTDPEVKGEFESYDYPFIKWKPKLLPTGALVQLETMLDESTNEYRPRLKYKMYVFVKGGNLIPSNGIQINLLDVRGFSLGNFSISSNSFSLVSGSQQVLEARGTTNISEIDYKRAVDYSVK